MPLARIQASIVRNLFDMGQLSESQCQTIVSADEDMSGVALETLLFDKYKIAPFQVLMAKAQAFKLPPINIKSCLINEATFAKLEQNFCRENLVLPLGTVGNFIVIAVSDPFDLNKVSEVTKITEMRVSTLLGLESAIKSVLGSSESVYKREGFEDVVEALGGELKVDEEFDEEISDEESAPIIRLANRIIEEAYYAGASDIHVEPFEKETRVRIRIDGVLREQLSVPPTASKALLARLKVMANLDIAEKRLPQDGRIQFKQYNNKGIDTDLRVATAPLNHGEGIVMRILDKQKSMLPLPALGFSEENLEKYRKLINRSYGMVLHCGPTGSGKSMTLYSALNEINKVGVCIRTAEDPIEYTLDGILQMQTHRKIGLTFANALRAFLRQDPDVILVGEIRDKETANIAVEAALTGHLLFSTLHTNDAPTTISRLTEMGVEPFMISASLVCVCAQRLMRRVCQSCSQLYEQAGNEAEIIKRALGWSGKVPEANDTGCPTCGDNGYKGRIGIHELMAINEDLIQAINSEEEAIAIKRIAMENGMKTLHQDSMLKVKEGLSTMQEALSIIPPDVEEYAASKQD